MEIYKKALIIITLCCLGLLPSTVSAQEETARLDQVKAVFLFKFVDYITWPAYRNLQAGDQFNMCVQGRHPFGDTLEIIADKQNKYRYRILYYYRNPPSSNCHILFTSRPEEIPQDLKGVFLVSDAKGFARRGGIMELAEESGKINLIANIRASESSGFKISSRLLKVADVIR